MIMGSPSQTRRQRGYAWEKTIVKRFLNTQGWDAVRLGSPSVSLPDVMAVNADRSTMFAIEAKSGAGDLLYVPYDQLTRCIWWLSMFRGRFETRTPMMAFHFLAKKRNSDGTHTPRKGRDWFFAATDEFMLAIPDNLEKIVCKYNGETYGIAEGKRVPFDVLPQNTSPHDNPADLRKMHWGGMTMWWVIINDS